MALQYHFPTKERSIEAMLDHCIGRYLTRLPAFVMTQAMIRESSYRDDVVLAAAKSGINRPTYSRL